MREALVKCALLVLSDHADGKVGTFDSVLG